MLEVEPTGQRGRNNNVAVACAEAYLTTLSTTVVREQDKPMRALFSEAPSLWSPIINHNGLKTTPIFTCETRY